MKKIVKKILPMAILIVAIAGYILMQQSATEPQHVKPENIEIIAEYFEAKTQTVSLTINSQGTVEPAKETELMAEVAGKIIFIADRLHTGGIFLKGELLFEIEPKEYQDVVTEAEAELARAHSQLEKEEAHAGQAEKNWKLLGKGRPSRLALRVPQLAEAQAAVRAATAGLQRAKRNLQKTRVTAPYDLLVRGRQANLYSYVVSGTPLAQVFSVDAVEVRLPLTAKDFVQLEFASKGINSSQEFDGPMVKLKTAVAGHNHSWQGKIVRSENIYNPKSRVTHVVAKVVDPYGVHSAEVKSPLAVGMFVQAEITGRKMTDKVVVPSTVLQDADSISGNVWVIRDDNTLTRKSVASTYTQAGMVIIEKGLIPGEKICLNTLEFAAENMKVKPVHSGEILLGVNR